MRMLAIYDMDKTLTHGATWLPFLIGTAGTLAPWRLALLPVAGLATLSFALGKFDRAGLKEATHRLMLGAHLSELDAARAAAKFADRIVTREVYPGAREQIARDRAAGYVPVMATASYRFYAGAIASRLGIEHVIGTEVERDAAGNLLPRIAGENCYGPAKLRMIEAWMRRMAIPRQQTQIRFYSDHVSDAPTLEWADDAIAVNAHGPLRTMAEARGWQVLDWER